MAIAHSKAKKTRRTIMVTNAVANKAIESEIYHSVEEPETTGSKYNRTIMNKPGESIVVDVYDVLEAFQVTCPALQHLIKKALCAGLRGHKNAAEDLVEIRDASERAMHLNDNRS